MVKTISDCKMLRLVSLPGVFAFLVSLLITPTAYAVTIPTYFGWDLINFSFSAKQREVLQLQEIGYIGESNLEDIKPFPFSIPDSLLLRTPMPNFPGFDVGFGTGAVSPNHDSPFQFQGIPDVTQQTVGIGPPSGTGATFSNGGDGETTRTIGAAVPIDWVPAGVSTPWGTLPFPSIGIVQVETLLYGVYDIFSVTGNDFNRTPDATSEVYDASLFNPGTGVVLGLIPFGADTELDSGLSAPQDDIYNNNPGGGFIPISGGGGEVGARFSAAAAVVPLPAAFWLFGTGLLGLIGISRSKKAA